VQDLIKTEETAAAGSQDYNKRSRFDQVLIDDQIISF
jgi:hypothetical protein